MAEEKKKKVDYSSAWKEAREIVWRARWRLGIGSVLMLISRLAGMVLPASTKYIGDEVFTKSKLRAVEMDRAGNRNFDFDSGGDIICSVADFGRGGATGDHRNAKARDGEDRAFADFVF